MLNEHTEMNATQRLQKFDNPLTQIANEKSLYYITLNIFVQHFQVVSSVPKFPPVHEKHFESFIDCVQKACLRNAKTFMDRIQARKKVFKFHLRLSMQNVFRGR